MKHRKALPPQLLLTKLYALLMNRGSKAIHGGVATQNLNTESKFVCTQNANKMNVGY